MFLTRLHYGKEHNLQRSRRALERRQETVRQEINLRSLLPPHSESSDSGTGREDRHPGRGCPGPREPETGRRPQPEDSPGHSRGPEDDSALWLKTRPAGTASDRHRFSDGSRTAGR